MVENVKVRVRGRSQTMTVGQVLEDMDYALLCLAKAKARHPHARPEIDAILPKLVRPDRVTDYKSWCDIQVAVRVAEIV